MTRKIKRKVLANEKKNKIDLKHTTILVMNADAYR